MVKGLKAGSEGTFDDADMRSIKEVYTRGRYARSVIERSGLQPAERNAFEAIFEQNKGNMTILDIGVGGGRTTEPLLEHADRYVGIDYSRTMIRACKERFSDRKNAIFMERDARDLSFLGDDEFDLVVFSFNGIDCMDPGGKDEVPSGDEKGLEKRRDASVLLSLDKCIDERALF